MGIKGTVAVILLRKNIFKMMGGGFLMKGILAFWRRVWGMVDRPELDEQTAPLADEGIDQGTPVAVGPNEFDPDRPISPSNKTDRLGFQTVAKKLASSLLTQATSQGLVMSIEGAWGSGKSSLVNLLATEIIKDQKHSPEVVRFEPWLVGDRDGMLAELMSNLASAVERIKVQEEKRGRNLGKEAEKIVKNFRTYASKASRYAAPIASLAGHVGVPGGELTAKSLKSISEVIDKFDLKPLPQAKRELVDGLHKLGRRIVVIIDDLDRLEPRESAEIIRLIKAVADFPNIIYVLCYDQNILSNSLKSAIAINDGTSFLEKIVQVRFKVPLPEAFDLRRWVFDECIEFYYYTTGEHLPRNVFDRFQSVCDIEGSLIKTPRHVVRVINAIKLYWPPISGKVDYADLVWLQMVRIENEDFYSWIEKYLVEYAAISDGASIHESDRIEFSKRLMSHVVSGNVGSARSIWTIKEFIPGIKMGFDVDDKERLFNTTDDSEREEFENDRRLGSPMHSRYYFSFDKPAGSLDDNTIHNFIASAVDGGELAVLVRKLIRSKRPQGGNKFDLLLDRLNRMDETRLPGGAVPSILMALANCMDEAGDVPVGAFGVRWTWRSAKKLFKRLFKKLPPDQRDPMVREIFGSGEAIGWLMSELVRDQTFAHGRYGDRPVPEEDRLFSAGELDDAIGQILKRFKSADRQRIIDAPDLLSVMYGWNQAGDEAGVREWVTEQQADDAKFLKLLSGCRGWRATDKGTDYPLNRRDLSHFLDFDQALGRLKAISEDAEKPEKERLLASELLKAAEIGE